MALRTWGESDERILGKDTRGRFDDANHQGPPLPEDWACDFIGGTGLAARIMYQEIPAGADPLGPENVLVFSTVPFQGGSRILGSGRFSVCAKSPLTGIFGESTGGGYNAEEFKKAGFDALVVKGKASNPSTSSSTTDK